MKGSELKKLRLNVPQTAQQASAELGVTERTWFRWEAKDIVWNFAIVYWLDLHNIKDMK